MPVTPLAVLPMGRTVLFINLMACPSSWTLPGLPRLHSTHFSSSSPSQAKLHSAPADFANSSLSPLFYKSASCCHHQDCRLAFLERLDSCFRLPPAAAQKLTRACPNWVASSVARNFSLKYPPFIVKTYVVGVCANTLVHTSSSFNACP